MDDKVWFDEHLFITLGLHLSNSRAWGLLGSVVTVRLIVLAAPQYIDRVGSYSIVS